LLVVEVEANTKFQINEIQVQRHTYLIFQLAWFDKFFSMDVNRCWT